MPSHPFADLDLDDIDDENALVANGLRNSRYDSRDELEPARRRLFETGSEFKPTRREDIIGIDNVLVEIDQVIHWLKHAKEYQAYGSRLEPGVIFEGDAGTGKTLVSRYIATKSEAFFVNVRDWPHQGSLFTDSDIRALFEATRAHYASTNQPTVLFWDEFENGARERRNATPEQVATISQLTAELDGIHGKNEGLLLIGCTNYIYGIDEALRRSGRMGLQIEFHAPDRAGKRSILEHYLSNTATDGDIDSEMLSYFFDPDATAADIEESCVEAWRYAVHRVLRAGKLEDPALSQEDLIEVFLKRLVGPPTTFINLTPKARLSIAIHEVGHALIACVYDIPLRLITVQPGKKSLGRTMTAEIEDHISTVKEMVDHLRIGVGSIAAERVAGLDDMLSSSGDIAEVNQMAAKLVDRNLLGDQTHLLNVAAIAETRGTAADSADPNISQAAIENSDADIERILVRAYNEALGVMDNIGGDNILKIANIVNAQTTMTGYQFKDMVYQILNTSDLTQFAFAV